MVQREVGFVVERRPRLRQRGERGIESTEWSRTPGDTWPEFNATPLLVEALCSSLAFRKRGGESG